jgi:hypothetical protein
MSKEGFAAQRGPRDGKYSRFDQGAYMLTKKAWFVLAAAVACLMTVGTLVSQETQPRRGDGAAPRADARRPEMRMREALGATEEQWKTMGPQIEKVQRLIRDSEGPMPGMMGRPPRRPDGAAASAPAMPESDAMQKTAALRTLLEDKNSQPAQIKDAVSALRKARTQARKDLTAARKELSKMVSGNQRMEAALVLRGILE